MTGYDIPQSAIEAADRGYREDIGTNTLEQVPGRHDERLAKAFRAAFDELGMRQQFTHEAELTPDGSEGNNYRLVSRWMPVEES